MDQREGANCCMDDEGWQCGCVIFTEDWGKLCSIYSKQAESVTLPSFLYLESSHKGIRTNVATPLITSVTFTQRHTVCPGMIFVVYRDLNASNNLSND